MNDRAAAAMRCALPDLPDFIVPMYLCAQTARVDIGLVPALPMFEIYLRSARRLRRAFRLVAAVLP
jgi:hypothetical protein